MKWKKIEVMLEFLVFGIVIGITEDIIAIKLTTDAVITKQMIVIVVFIAIPFAILGEIVADNIDLAKILKRIFEKQ